MSVLNASGISGVVEDARRLMPDVNWACDALCINAANHSNRASLIQTWLPMQTLSTSGPAARKMQYYSIRI